MYYRMNPFTGQHMFHDAPGLPPHQNSGNPNPYTHRSPDQHLEDLEESQAEFEERFYASQLSDGWNLYRGGSIDSGSDYQNLFLYEEEHMRLGFGWDDPEDDWDDDDPYFGGF